MTDDFSQDTDNPSDESSKNDYDWIDDPFNDKKQAQRTGMGGKTKLALGCGCLLIIIIMVIIAVMMFLSLGDLAFAA